MADTHHLDQIAERVERLLLRHEELQRTNTLLLEQVQTLQTERDSLKSRVAHGDLIFCATPADYVIPAGISNWGACALVAALSLLAGRLLLRPPEHEHAVLQALLAAGAVDGCTRKKELSVDGLGWEDYATTIADIYRETVSALEMMAGVAVPT